MRTPKLRLMWLLAAATMIFAACSKDDDNDGPTILVEDGLYVVGESISNPDLTLDGLMENGYIDNYPDASLQRDGLYVKTINYNSSKEDFQIVKVAGKETIYYGAANLADSSEYYIGDIAVDTKIKLPSSGIYFIIFDEQTQKIGFVKVNPGICGEMTNWADNLTMQLKESDAKSASWEINDLELKPGKQFKIRLNNFWNVKIETSFNNVQTNLGTGTNQEIIYGGDNWVVGTNPSEPGVYTVNLSWNFKEGYNVLFTKTADITLTDWSSTKIEIVGDGVSAENTGAIQDTIWNWNVFLYSLNDGIPQKEGNIYTWKWENVKLLQDKGFKIRCRDESNSFDAGNNIVDFTNSDNVIQGEGNSDIKVSLDGNYNLTLTIDAENNDTKKLVINKVN